MRILDRSVCRLSKLRMKKLTRIFHCNYMISAEKYVIHVIVAFEFFIFCEETIA